jgi:tetratricopeptide (TPR) repeat protein
MREAARVNPRHDRAWYGLALVLIRKGALAQAVDALEQNIALQPLSPYGFYQLGMTFHHLGRADQAQRMVDRLRQFEPKYAATLERDIQRTVPQCLSGDELTARSKISVTDNPDAMTGAT